MDKNPFIPSERAMDRKESAHNLQEEDKRRFAEEQAELARQQGGTDRYDDDLDATLGADRDLTREAVVPEYDDTEDLEGER